MSEAAAITDPERARQLAVKILTYRARSRKELVDRLVAKNVEAALAEATAARCEELRLVDDRVLAEGIVNRILGERPAGRMYLSVRLRRRGIADGLAREVIDAALGERDALDDALRVARSRAKTFKPGLEPLAAARRLTGALARRGFEPDVARAAVERVLGDEVE